MEKRKFKVTSNVGDLIVEAYTQTGARDRGYYELSKTSTQVQLHSVDELNIDNYTSRLPMEELSDIYFLN